MGVNATRRSVSGSGSAPRSRAGSRTGSTAASSTTSLHRLPIPSALLVDMGERERESSSRRVVSHSSQTSGTSSVMPASSVSASAGASASASASQLSLVGVVGCEWRGQKIKGRRSEDTYTSRRRSEDTNTNRSPTTITATPKGRRSVDGVSGRSGGRPSVEIEFDFGARLKHAQAQVQVQGAPSSKDEDKENRGHQRDGLGSGPGPGSQAQSQLPSQPLLPGGVPLLPPIELQPPSPPQTVTPTTVKRASAGGRKSLDLDMFNGQAQSRLSPSSSVARQCIRQRQLQVKLESERGRTVACYLDFFHLLHAYVVASSAFNAQ
ncbi:hypothetical protein CPB84DRAFT_253545 [Gymnopilus junonius]|uniref:Uncharacterized protein n=1 Tax=Gymnopilus junonius TaxID=109634 RepID=A0A9P5NFZ0_GYMJU|nr:hypothetical protein CPB84DRAFT_253545 [Gymnopilus junonius]